MFTCRAAGGGGIQRTTNGDIIFFIVLLLLRWRLRTNLFAHGVYVIFVSSLTSSSQVYFLLTSQMVAIRSCRCLSP
ncbi:hypothetical protein Bca52824_035248 [Brassica carinata]|uniref:Uncharacterized protein n=1 Tax=Brassica carinata TaxID=52824 RepID=A0A8X7V3X1_BRACI|nr:hypothetical protein Bca52824_035248 [Brassica carinata]